MSNICISDLHPIGSSLFDDSESFLSSLSEEEFGVYGGSTPACISISSAAASLVSITATVAISLSAAGAFVASVSFGYQVAKDQGWT